MQLLPEIQESDMVQGHCSTLIALSALERDLLIRQDMHNPCVRARLKTVEFYMDELAIRVLERESPYEC